MRRRRVGRRSLWKVAKRRLSVSVQGRPPSLFSWRFVVTVRCDFNESRSIFLAGAVFKHFSTLWPPQLIRLRRLSLTCVCEKACVCVCVFMPIGSNTNTHTHTLGCYITLHNSWLTLMGGFIGLSRGCQVRATRTAPKPQLKIDLCQIIHSTTLNKFKNIALITLSACLCAFSSEHHVSPWSCWPTCFLHQL